MTPVVAENQNEYFVVAVTIATISLLCMAIFVHFKGKYDQFVYCEIYIALWTLCVCHVNLNYNAKVEWHGVTKAYEVLCTLKYVSALPLK